MCAYILKSDLVGSQVDGVEPASDGGAAPLGGTLKRVFDVVAASIALVLLAPLLLLVAALIRLHLRRPVLLSQDRVGFNGKVFACYKFRTMELDGEKVPHDHDTRKLENDPRATCLSNVLRKLSIDELPQLFNVLRGDMSLVGPCPVPPGEIARYGRHARAYYSARPGLTGMWQVDGRNSANYAGRVARDRYYARHWSLGLDLLLLLKTFSSPKKGEHRFKVTDRGSTRTGAGQRPAYQVADLQRD